MSLSAVIEIKSEENLDAPTMSWMTVAEIKHPKISYPRYISINKVLETDEAQQVVAHNAEVPVYVGSRAKTCEATDNCTIGKPEILQPGDLMVAVMNAVTDGFINQIPTGWNETEDFYWKMALANEPDDYTWYSSQIADWSGSIFVLRSHSGF